MKRKGSKVGSDLERLVEAWLQLEGWRTHRAAATGFNKFAKKGGGFGFAVKSHDLWGVFDLVAHKRSDTNDCETRAVQCTSPATRSVRREKIVAAGPWPRTWLVEIVHHKSRREGRRTRHFLYFEELWADGMSWGPPVEVEIDPKACEAHRRAKREAKKAAAK